MRGPWETRLCACDPPALRHGAPAALSPPPSQPPHPPHAPPNPLPRHRRSGPPPADSRSEPRLGQADFAGQGWGGGAGRLTEKECVSAPVSVLEGDPQTFLRRTAERSSCLASSRKRGVCRGGGSRSLTPLALPFTLRQTPGSACWGVPESRLTILTLSVECANGWGRRGGSAKLHPPLHRWANPEHRFSGTTPAFRPQPTPLPLGRRLWGGGFTRRPPPGASPGESADSLNPARVR